MGVENEWQIPPMDLVLPLDEIHVWRASLTLTSARIEDFHQLLTDQERLRASHFHDERDRKGYVSCHGILRIILGRYLGIEPSDLSFRFGEFGKPYLQDKINSIQIHFNFSHSYQLAIYAFSREREIGIDLEYVKPITNLRDIAAQFFSQNENKVLSTLSDELALQAFYHCWTRKEAYLKATGKGLQIPLDRFEVSMLPGEPARLVNVTDNTEEVDRWHLQDFAPETGYLGAIATEGVVGPLRFWQWE